jgi:hypothetical protein
MVSETECREAFIALLERIVAGWGTWEDEKLGGGRRCRIGLRTIPEEAGLMAAALLMVFGDDPTVERQIHSLRWIMGSVSPLVDSQGAFEW